MRCQRWRKSSSLRQQFVAMLQSRGNFVLCSVDCHTPDILDTVRDSKRHFVTTTVNFVSGQIEIFLQYLLEPDVSGIYY